jgi:signal transduction histidine kinase
VKFAKDSGQIIIEAEVSEGYVRIDVADDGPGIPAREIESVFYVCHQVDEEHTGQVPGAGMGLSLSRHIVQEHGGEIRITSPYRFPDHGTRVSIFLPLAASARVRKPEVAGGAWSDDLGVIEERSEVSS